MIDKFDYEEREAILEQRERYGERYARYAPATEVLPRHGPEMEGWVVFWGESILEVGNQHYLIESISFPGEHHSVDTAEGTCSCRGFECVKHCRHLTAIREYENEL